MICALLVFQTADLPAPLDLISPWLDMQTRTGRRRSPISTAQTHRRFIKTHTPYDGLPHDDRVTYICVGRDPRDVARSWDNHMANTDLVRLMTARDEAVGNQDLAELMPDGPPVHADSEIGRFWEWADAPIDGGPRGESLAALVHHISTFWAVRDRSNVLLLHYDELQADLDGQMRGVSAGSASRSTRRAGRPWSTPRRSTRCAPTPTASRPTPRTRSGRTTSSSSTGARAASGGRCSTTAASSVTSHGSRSSRPTISRGGCTATSRTRSRAASGRYALAGVLAAAVLAPARTGCVRLRQPAAARHQPPSGRRGLGRAGREPDAAVAALGSATVVARARDRLRRRAARLRARRLSRRRRPVLRLRHQPEGDRLAQRALHAPAPQLSLRPGRRAQRAVPARHRTSRRRPSSSPTPTSSSTSRVRSRSSCTCSCPRSATTSGRSAAC